MPKRIYNSNADRQRAYRDRKRGGPPKHENNGWDLLWAARAAKAWMHGDAACHGCGYKECACASIAANFPKWRGSLAVTPPEQKVAGNIRNAASPNGAGNVCNAARARY